MAFNYTVLNGFNYIPSPEFKKQVWLIGFILINWLHLSKVKMYKDMALIWQYVLVAVISRLRLKMQHSNL